MPKLASSKWVPPMIVASIVSLCQGIHSTSRGCEFFLGHQESVLSKARVNQKEPAPRLAKKRGRSSRYCQSYAAIGWRLVWSELTLAWNHPPHYGPASWVSRSSSFGTGAPPVEIHNSIPHGCWRGCCVKDFLLDKLLPSADALDWKLYTLTLTDCCPSRLVGYSKGMFWSAWDEQKHCSWGCGPEAQGILDLG